MKKFKSLLSLMLVMILMLSMVSTMAFAAEEPDGSKENPFVVTIKANAPYFYGDKYIGAGVTPGDLPLYEGTHYQVNVSAGDTSVTATPVALNAVDGLLYSSDVDKYYKVTFESSTIEKPVLKLSAERMDFNANTKLYVGASPKVEGLDGSHTATDITYSVVDGGTSVTVTPASVVVKDASGNVVNNCYKIQYVPATFNKPTATVSVAEPQFNPETGKYEITGLDVGTIGALKLTSEASALVASPNFNMEDVVITKNGDTVTAKLDKSKVYLYIGSNDVTAAYVLTVNNGEHTRETIHIYPNTPVNGKANGYSVSKADGSAFTACDVIATVYIDNGVAKIDASSVQVMRSGLDYVNDYNVVLHTTGVDGNTGTPAPETTPSPEVTTPPTNTPVVTTKELVIKPVNYTKAYDSYYVKAQYARGVEFINGTALDSNHKLNTDVLDLKVTKKSGANVDPDKIWEVGTYTKTLSFTSTTNRIVDKTTGEDVTDQYHITLVPGELTIQYSGWVSPDTGDHSNIVLWIVLLAVSAAAAGAAVFFVLKKNKKA